MERSASEAAILDRREAIRRVGLVLGGTALVGGSGLLQACESGGRPEGIPSEAIGAFTPDDMVWLNEVAETILPETGTPGAKAAMVGPFMALMVTDTYDDESAAAFRAGIETLEGAATEGYGAGFAQLAPEDRRALLERFDAERAAWEGESPHWFRMVKELTLLGYFTSAIGCTVAQRYVEAPGRFDPCVPYEPGERNWANHA